MSFISRLFACFAGNNLLAADGTDNIAGKFPTETIP
jgi:hypothetical protein